MTPPVSDFLLPRADGLLPVAMRFADSRGRVHAEPEHAFRNPFQRDRDRVLHSASFRRLEYKTQVFVNGEGDHYRTRLTHTLEVAQISRTMARELRLNEDLAEAVALSHDLGHTPFGHAGERLLDKLLADAGGFDHNLQGLRVVDVLEKRYAAFDGLNLTYETREAFIRHAGAKCADTCGFSPNESPLIEVAVTLLADDIAYLAHDIDDGLYSGILAEEDLLDVPVWRMAGSEQLEGYGALPPSLKRVEGVRRLINILVSDAIHATRKNIAALELDSPEKVRRAAGEPTGFSEEIKYRKEELKQFLYANFYRHPNVVSVMENAQEILQFLFNAYLNDPEKMPEEYRKNADMWGARRAVADYVAGMTDRFAMDEYKRLGGRGKTRENKFPEKKV